MSTSNRTREREIEGIRRAALREHYKSIMRIFHEGAGSISFLPPADYMRHLLAAIQEPIGYETTQERPSAEMEKLMKDLLKEKAGPFEPLVTKDEQDRDGWCVVLR